MDYIIKEVLQDLTNLVDTQDRDISVLNDFMTVLIELKYIQCFEIYTNGKWALGLKYTNSNGIQQLTYCVNINWFPIEEKFQ